MASVNKDKKGWRVLFVDQNGVRRQIRPGKVNKTTARQIGMHIDRIVATIASQGTLPLQTAKWLSEIGDTLHAKLVNAGLVEPRETDSAPARIRLTDFVADFIADGKTSHGNPAARNTIAK